MFQKRENKIFNLNKKNRFNYKIILSIFLLVLLLLIISLANQGLANYADRILKRLRNEKPEPVIIYKAEKTIKMLEGWMNADFYQELKNKHFNHWEEEDFLLVAGERRVYDVNKKQNFSRDWSQEFPFLNSKPENLSLEGYLFPDTYRVFASSTPEEVIQRLLNNFATKITEEMVREIKRQGKTLHEIITMASIIEKEAPIFNQTSREDAKIISGIFWNRLNIGMALQSDATLSYIFEDNKPVHSGDELKVDSPYNSYLYRGLPPGPICNPGLIAIEAAIYPIETDYFYFLTPLDGSRVYYAKTYQEHLNNKYKYLK